MLRNISISAFINTIFILALIAISLTFAIFIKLDKQRFNISMQKKYELVAENLLKTLDTNPSKNGIKIILKQFKMQQVEDNILSLTVLNDAKVVVVRQTINGMYRIFSLEDNLYTYVQKDGYNLMIQDTQNYSYNLLIISLAIALSIGVLFSLYYILKKKLKPLRNLNREIKKFSEGDLNVKIVSNSKDEIGTIAKTFDEAITHINNQTKSKELFMRNMMHELKTPITKAMFIAETLDDEKKRETLQRAFQRMDDIIKELAMVERLTSNSTLVYKEATSFFKIYKKTVEIAMLNPNKIDAKINDFRLNADTAMLSVALKNLIDNAIKFSPDRHACISANKYKIDIISKGEKLKNNLEYYTEPFSQEEKRSDGFGLGLYIVKTIAHLHGYRLVYQHNAGKNIFSILIK
ncbi:ArsS family sensor histidine kinase [Halarcobacter ebronensis]|uniref:histidine kinase n=1 Tax=Halarcobacter ebronensis TaxID=1462615 RepID=A0A4Q1ANC3_9BACT|nr:ArsS family sensor histidine kinase [Halarcobacter ebronensis]QKF83265.1 two-component system sensor histidine kinase [Halarcobacter ebronensis]RXK05829.1 two-component sensor histidine kinase [Halarcobacter ebronensis]